MDAPELNVFMWPEQLSYVSWMESFELDSILSHPVTKEDNFRTLAAGIRCGLALHFFPSPPLFELRKNESPLGMEHAQFLRLPVNDYWCPEARWIYRG